MLKTIKQIDCLFIASALSYIIYMMIIPKAVTTGIVVVLFFVLVVTVVSKMVKTRKIIVPIYSKKFFPFLAFTTLSILWTVNSDYSFPLVRTFLTFEFGTLVCLLVKRKKDLDKVVKGFICGGIISSIIVLFYQYQFIGLIRLGDEIYGSAMEFSGGITISAYCCLFLWKRESKKMYLILFLMFLTICALSGSRTAIIYPFLFLFVLLFCYKQKIKQLLMNILLLSIAALGLLYIVLNLPVFYDVVGHRVETLLDDKTDDESYMERKEMKEYAIAFWIEKPFLGWGVNGFSKKYAAINKPVYSHCDYTEILCCYGIIGAILFYTPFAMLFFRKKIWGWARNDWNQSFLLTILIFSIFEITHSIVFLSVKNMMLVALCFIFLARKGNLTHV